MIRILGQVLCSRDYLILRLWDPPTAITCHTTTPRQGSLPFCSVGHGPVSICKDYRKKVLCTVISVYTA